MDVPLHFAERALTLHLFLKGLQRLINIVVTDENLNQGSLSFGPTAMPGSGRKVTVEQNSSCARKSPSVLERPRYRKALAVSRCGEWLNEGLNSRR